MLNREELEEIRQDLLAEDRADAEHERLMRVDLEYFVAKSNYEDALDILRALKTEAKMYDRCIHDIIVHLKEDI